MLVQLGTLGAQTPEDDDSMMMLESGETMQEKPVDDIVERRLTYEKRVLPYDNVREADIFWEKRIWRVIDTREKMNLPFAYPDHPFFTILMDAAKSGEITVYSTEDDKFSNPFTPEEVKSIGVSRDTIYVTDPETYETTMQVVTNELNPEEIKRYRIKEVWFFDIETSTLQVRILGIAPMIDNKDDNGNFRFEQPLFWVYYPEARKVLAHERVFNFYNDASPMSWEDLFEMRFFSSYIWKESNVYNRCIQDYVSGVDILLESQRIKSEIFNFEHDLWSY
jgi:gliding motility associated protien GldN